MGRVVSVTPRPRFTPRNGPPVHIRQEAGWTSELVMKQSLEEKSFAFAGDETPVVWSVVRHYSDWVTPAYWFQLNLLLYDNGKAKVKLANHYDAWGNGGNAPCILNFALWPIYPLTKSTPSPGNHCIRGWLQTTYRSGRQGKLLTVPRI
jgi:hypothetical protein